jgi:hypothetical protein
MNDDPLRYDFLIEKVLAKASKNFKYPLKNSGDIYAVQAGTLQAYLRLLLTGSMTPQELINLMEEMV